MPSAELTKASFDSFHIRSHGKRIILIYPWKNYRNLFLSYFLDNAKEGLLYYRLSSDQNTIERWTIGMEEEFRNVLGDNFTNHLRPALENNNPSELGRALALDLAAYSTNRLVLFIDQIDYIEQDDALDEFVNALIETLPDHVQIAFSSRLINRHPWFEMVESDKAMVMGTEMRRNEMIFTIEDNPKPQLEVYALGRGYALVNGHTITTWDGALPRNLFFYFMDHPEVSREDIFKTFWPSLNTKDATNVFHVTKRKITERISAKVDDGGNYELTQYNVGMYLPSDKIVRHYDVGDFEDAIAQADLTNDDHEAMVLLRRAVDIYRAPFLQSMELAWVIKRRAELREKYMHALLKITDLAEGIQNYDQAIGFLGRAAKEMPEREDVSKRLITMLIQQGSNDEARLHYRQLEKTLNDTLKMAPSDELRQMIESLS